MRDAQLGRNLDVRAQTRQLDALRLVQMRTGQRLTRMGHDYPPTPFELYFRVKAPPGASPELVNGTNGGLSACT